MALSNARGRLDTVTDVVGDGIGFTGNRYRIVTVRDWGLSVTACCPDRCHPALISRSCSDGASRRADPTAVYFSNSSSVISRRGCFCNRFLRSS